MLPPAVPGRLHRITCEAGELTVYDAGSGPPLLLVHSINAAASSASLCCCFHSLSWALISYTSRMLS